MLERIKFLTPLQQLVLGYLVLILAGAVILKMPISIIGNNSVSFLDSIFTSASAVSTTGLVVVDTGTFYSFFGQCIILLLIQIGGLGYMVFFAVISLSIRKRFGIREKMLLKESISRPTGLDVKKYVKLVFVYTAIFELLGAILLFLVFIKRFPFNHAAFSAIFHSVSAFCTAGFSLYVDSFTFYADDILINIIITIITIAGAIGFFVLQDISEFIVRIKERKYPRQLSEHSKLVIVVSTCLIVSDTVLLIVLWRAEGNVGHRILIASFQAISAATTTGFNSIDIGTICRPGLAAIIVLMFIGASPGSTGGGIKTSTFGLVVLFIKGVIKGNSEIFLFKRLIPFEAVNKAVGLFILSILYLMILISLLALTQNGIALLALIFEAFSALGTVGLSMGITSSLNNIGKSLIIITMFIGRVGPLAIGYFIAGKQTDRKYSLPSGNILVG